jgi:hypothetical protein
MKQLFVLAFITLAASLSLLAQPSGFYINSGVIDSPPDIAPQVYATNFINNGTMNINLGASFTTVGGLVIQSLTSPPFDFSDVVNFTNNGVMSGNAGYRFDTAPATSHGENFARHMAATFLNDNEGVISAGSISNFAFTGVGLLFASGLGNFPAINIAATNIVNAGILNSGQNGLISVTGSHVDLSGSVVNMEGLGASSIFSVGGSCTPFTIVNPGIFDQYWGIGRGTNTGAFFNLPDPITPLHRVTFATSGGGIPTVQSFFVPNAQASELNFAVASNGVPDQSNLITQVVFAGNFDNTVSTTIRWEGCVGDDFFIPVIQWVGFATNVYTQMPITNTLYLADFFGGSTNFTTSTNFNLAGGLIPTQSPVNYQYTRTFPDYLALTFPGFSFASGSLDAFVGFTNSYSAYGVAIAPVTTLPDPTVLGSTFSNTPGRIEINASGVLDLTGTTLTGPNYLSLIATNHFAGSAGAQFSVPVSELNLSSTNGQIHITNLVAQSIPFLSGTVEAWSGQWTNIVNGATNRFHVLMVASSLSPTSATEVLDFLVRSTNSAAPNSPGDVVISDVLNVNSNFVVNGRSLTVTSNDASAANPFGEINLLSTAILWSGNLPNVNYVTNGGVISTFNSIFFEHRQSTTSPSPSDSPYGAVVNHGTISSGGSTIWANYIENTGSGLPVTNGFFVTTNLATIVSSGAPLTLQSQTSVLSNGLLEASQDVMLDTGQLVLSNQTILTSGALRLTVTNQLNQTADGSGRTWTNRFAVSAGFDLPMLPASGGDLLGTTIASTAAGLTSLSTWPGRDQANSPSGFTNNMSVGHVIFDATTNNFGTTGKFRFSPANGNNAIYIDLISLADAATNHANNNYPQFIIDPGMKIYFGGALIGNADISEKLNGANGGAFQWVSNWNNGPFSSTNLLYPSGTNYSFNRALVASCDIDSNGNGIPNCQDPTPIPTPDTIAVRVRLTNAPSLKALVSWNAPAFSTNYLYTRTNLTSTSWLLVTNFIQGPIMTPVTITNQARTTGGSLYRVGISFRN